MDPYLVFRRARALGAAAAILMLVLVLAPGARPASAPPLVELQSVTIANGAATISGTLGPTAAGAEVTVNGHPLSLDSSGHFAGVVQLGGASSLDLGVANSVSGEHTHFTIPLTDSLAGVGAIPSDVLSAVQHVEPFCRRGRGDVAVVLDARPAAGRSLFRLDQDHAVRRARTVEGCRVRPLQDGHRLDVVRVQIV